MLLLHLGIPPSGHGYAPPIAVAVITVLAKKGCTVLKCICAFITPLPLLCQKTFRQWRKTVLASQSAQRKHDTSPAHPNFPRNRPPPLPPAEQSCEHGAARFSFPSLRIQNSLSRNRLWQALSSDSSLLRSPRFRRISSQKKREKERLEHSGLDTITSFSCRACHVSDDVSLYKGNPSFRPCPRCGQSDRECLLLNIRLPE